MKMPGIIRRMGRRGSTRDVASTPRPALATCAQPPGRPLCSSAPLPLPPRTPMTGRDEARRLATCSPYFRGKRDGSECRHTRMRAEKSNASLIAFRGWRRVAAGAVAGSDAGELQVRVHTATYPHALWRMSLVAYRFAIPTFPLPYFTHPHLHNVSNDDWLGRPKNQRALKGTLLTL